jgi:hypothetical protein
VGKRIELNSSPSLSLAYRRRCRRQQHSMMMMVLLMGGTDDETANRCVFKTF